MADSCSSSPMDDNDTSVHDTKKPSIDEKIDVTIVANGKIRKRKMTVEQYCDFSDKLLEIEQITCEERLVHEQINRINLEKQHLQNLLTILHRIDSNDKRTNSQYSKRLSQKLQSTSDLK